jgi:hypothetical protein
VKEYCKGYPKKVNPKYNKNIKYKYVNPKNSWKIIKLIKYDM